MLWVGQHGGGDREKQSKLDCCGWWGSPRWVGRGGEQEERAGFELSSKPAEGGILDGDGAAVSFVSVAVVPSRGMGGNRPGFWMKVSVGWSRPGHGWDGTGWARRGDVLRVP